HVLVPDRRRRTDAHIRERLLDLRREGQHRVQSRAVPLASRQLVFRDDGERRGDPAGSAIVGPDADAAVWIFGEADVRRALIGRLSRNFDDTAAAEPAIADAGPGGDKAG